MLPGWYNCKPEPAPILFAAFDVETQGLGGALILGTTTDPEGRSRAYKGNPDTICGLMFDEMWKRPFLRGSSKREPSKVIWYAHNAQYDWRYLLKYALKQSDWHVEVSMRTDTDIYQVMVKRGSGRRIETLIMRDSYALFPATLKDFSKQFAPDHAKMDFDHEHDTIDPDNPDHIAYAIRDTEALRLSLIAYDAAVRTDYGVGLRATAASTALAGWERTLDDDVIYYGSDGEIEAFARQAYFGGLVFLTSTDAHSGAVTYDINSSYPHQMRTHGVPGGKCARTTRLQFEAPAFYRVTVTAPDDLTIPILPCRDARGGVLWPRGTFETTVSNVELLFALDHGYALDRVHEGHQWEHIEYPFSAFVDRAEAIRQAARKTPRETVAKVMQNSVYGKFGSQRVRSRMIILDPGEDVGEGWAPWDEEGQLWIEKETVEDMQVKVEWAAWITAQARLHLLRTAYAMGVDQVLYGDTDSLTVKAGTPAPDCGAAYGQWKEEKIWIVFRPIAPKVYAGCVAAPEGPRLMGAAKGLAKKAMRGIHWRRLMEGHRLRIKTDTLGSLLCSLKKEEIIAARVLKRKSTDIRKSKNYEREGHKIRPRKIA